MLKENRRPMQIWVRSRVIAFLITLLVCTVVGKQFSFAQGATAAIRGAVVDQQGAVIPGVLLTLTNLNMQASQTSETNQDGQYTFASITPGRYSLTASKAGFATVTLPDFELAVAQAATQDIQLPIGSTSASIRIDAAAVSIDTSSTGLGTVIETKEVNSLPLNGRNFTQLLAITPGVSPISTGQNASGGGGWAGDSIGAFTFPSVNGQTNRSNMFLLDGFTDYAFIGNYAVQPIIDAIQEFKVQSHDDSPAYGGSMGGIMNVVSAGGTTQYRGDLWEFLRNNDLDAANRFNSVVTPYKQNQYGAVVGGPVFPRVKNPRLAKTFFFGGWEGFRSTRAAASLGVVPTPQELAGDFSAITNQLYDPFSTAPDPANPGEYTRTAFTYNNISSRLDPNMVTYAKAFYPQPEVLNVSGFNYRDNTPNTLSSNIYTLRADHEFNSQFSTWFRLTKFSQIASSATGIGPEVTSTNPVNGYQTGISVSWASKSGDKIISGRFGRTKAFTLSSRSFASSLLDAWKSANFNPLYASGFSGGLSFDPGQEFSDFVSIPNGTYQGNDITLVWEGAADATWAKGRHTLQAGFDINTNNTQLPILEVEQQYSSYQTSNLESTTPSGNDFASFLLGVPTWANRRNVTVETHGGWVDGFYVADKWRVNRNLTINAGLRYDMTLWPIYGNPALGDQYLGDTDLNTGQYWLARVPPACSAGVSPCIPGGVLPANVIVTDQGNGKILHNVYDNVEPRLGIAYQVNPGTVIRATGGRYFDNWASILQLSTNYEGTWPDTAFLAVSNLNTTVPTVTAEDPLSLGSGGQIIPAATPWGQVNYMLDPYYKNGESYQWNLGVQQQVGRNTVLEADYVGSHSLRLDYGAVRNTAIIPGPGPVAAREPFPYITPTNFDTSTADANYNALQAQVRTVIAAKFTLLGAYTWSKTIDEGCDGFFGGEGCSVQNVYNPRGDRSVAGYDIPQMLTATFVYQLPFGKDEKFHLSNPVVDTIAGGWSTSGIFTTRSGQPFNAFASGDIANVGAANGIRPNKTCRNPYTGSGGSQYLNASCFSTPAAFTFGDEGRNDLRSAHVNNLDFSVVKSFRIPLSEATNLQFRTDIFNLFDEGPLGVPNTTNTSSTFGVVSSTATTEREIQFALKLYF
jgi:hypothetical protein